MATKLFLIRHGLTNYNQNKRYCSFTDIGLNTEGIRQAKKLKTKLSKEKIHKVYSSTSIRALNFAKIIFNGKAIEKQPDLREINFGIFEGLTYKQIMKKYPKVYKRWLSDPFKVIVPKGEDLYDFEKRVIRGFREIISDNKDKTVAVVCHGGTISIFLNYIRETKNFWKYIPRPGNLVIIEFYNKKARIRF